MLLGGEEAHNQWRGGGTNDEEEGAPCPVPALANGRAPCSKNGSRSLLLMEFCAPSSSSLNTLARSAGSMMMALLCHTTQNE